MEDLRSCKQLTKGSEYLIGKSESERIQIIRVWFTVMVVFIHAYTKKVNFVDGTLLLDVPVWLDWLKYLFSHVVPTCAVPGFFVLSSVLLYRKEFNWITNIRKKIKTLLVPYLFINTIWIVIFFVAQHISVFKSFFSNTIIADWSVLDWVNAYVGIYPGGAGGTGPLVYPLWFLRDLMILNLLAPAIKKVVDRFPRLVFLILISVFLFGLDTHFSRFGTDERDAVVFFILGYYLVRYRIRLKDVDKLDPVLLGGVYGISIVLECLLRDDPQRYVIRLLSITAGILFFFRFTTEIKNPVLKKRLLRLSQYTFPVFLLHEMSLSVLRKLVIKVLPVNAFFQVAEYFGIPVIIIGLCIAVSWLLQHFIPRLYNLAVGGRAS